MKKLLLFFAILISSLNISAQDSNSKIYELRIYTCHDGKLEDLLSRFRNHTMKIFEKHEMENIAYWTPVQENNNQLYYILAYPSKQSRDSSWKAFVIDPEWILVSGNSEKNGPIVKKVESKFMVLNKELTDKIVVPQDYSPRVVEMRNYICLPGKYPDIVKRFRDHTRDIFMAHGITNMMYFDTIEKEGEQPTLMYFISHSNMDKAKENWANFRADPKWIQAKTASEENGKIIDKIVSTYMVATDFSKLK